MPCANCEIIFSSRKSAPFIPLNGRRGDELYECIGCKQIWWQYDLIWHYWTPLSNEQFAKLKEKPSRKGSR